MKEQLWLVSPFESPNVTLAVAANRAGAFPVLHLGLYPAEAEAALRDLADKIDDFGVCVVNEEMSSVSLPKQATKVVIPWAMRSKSANSAKKTRREIWWQILSETEALEAISKGETRLILKGCEGAGLCGEESSFMLFLQLAETCRKSGASIRIQGGVGVHTAAAYLALGAEGVLLDSQLALFPECGISADFKAALSKLSGTEIKNCEGYRYWMRPGVHDPGDLRLSELLSKIGHTDEAEFLPLGQDIVLAAGYAAGYGRIKSLVHGMSRAMASHTRLAKTRDMFAEGTGMADNLGTKYPIAQGPMARISDVPEFLEAVAGGGALPFLAMSLTVGDAAEEMLTKTAALVGDKPWGVGMLGFAFPDVLAEQTERILRAKPSVVLIAGGRPSQAKPFEQAGIKVFLHVPAPSLLDMFLKEGARSFIFEGRESGGHVGPLYSALLWERQIERLLKQDGAATLSVFFAGGIHDAFSAAFVRIMAAPLSARDVNVGILMGTAYLYTEEIVKSGAITEKYQEMVLEKNHTLLLKSGSGQESRAVPSPYTEFFLSEKKRMKDEGLDFSEIILKLEDLNLGRLRIAAKGTNRKDGNLITLSPEEQLNDGLYMTGAVTALIKERTTIAKLHETVVSGSKELVTKAELQKEDISEKTDFTEVAVIGMAGIFPDAENIDEYWRNILFGKDSITEVKPERWSSELYFDNDAKDTDHSVSKWGGFISAIDFDAMEFGITPQSLAAIEPVQLLSLLVAKRALEDAGFTDLANADFEETSVIFGAQGAGELAAAYGSRAGMMQLFGEIPEEAAEALPRLTEDSFPGVLSNVISGRISNRLNTGGRNYTVDAACASSLAALDIAFSELSTGKANMVVLGGADLHNGIYDYLMFSSTFALSRKGRCSTFDDGADGIALGEGIGAVILKRLADAERDGDKIYAVLKGIGGSSDGKNLGLTAPSRHGQVNALERAYADAGVSPAEVGLIEAHGTGTVVGDRIEMSALTDVFLDAGAAPGRTQLGSVKTQIGHTKCAAGVAALIKAVMSVRHGLLPPTLNLTKPNDAYTKSSPFFFRTEKAGLWKEDRRIAGVSGFGFGGTNFHTIVENYSADIPAVPLKAWPSELCVFRGETPEEGISLLETVKSLYTANDGLDIKDIAYSLACMEKDKPVQFAVVAANRGELLSRIDAALEGRADEHVFPLNSMEGKVAFLFSGQGSQRVNMAADLFVTFPQLRSLLLEHPEYEDILFPHSVFTNEERKAQRAAITDTRNAQPLLGIVDLAIAELLRGLGIEADMVAGHSYGEIPALCYAGAFAPEELVKLSKERAEAILGAVADDPGRMAAVRADADRLADLLKDEDSVWAVNFNSPKQTVVAGTSGGIESFLEKLKKEDVACDELNVACAFHSPLLAGADKGFAATLENIPFRKAVLPVWSNTKAEPYPKTAAAIRKRLADHLVNPVRFTEEVQKMYEDGARIFVEAGPGGTLTGLVGAILKDKEITLIQTERNGAEGITYLLSALARYISTGRMFNVEKLFEGRNAKLLDINDPSLQKKAGLIWKIDGYKALPENGVLPAHAGKVFSGPILSANALKERYSVTDTELMMAYLDNMNAVIQHQRDVLVSYWGDSDLIGAQPSHMVFATEDIPYAAEEESPMAGDAGYEEYVELPEIASLNTDQLTDIIFEIVSEKTGYPMDMLGLDMELEADLSIDSIKKMEIIGGLQERVSFPDTDNDADGFFEHMVAVKTFRELLTWIESLGQESSPVPEDQDSEDQVTAEDSASGTESSPAQTDQYTMDQDIQDQVEQEGSTSETESGSAQTDQII